MPFLRRLRTSVALRRGANDGGVLAAIRSELSHELASSAPSAPAPFSSQVTHNILLPSLADPLTPNITPHTSLFPNSQDAPDFFTDVLLRRRDDSEEVLVSALLAPLQFVDQAPLPRDALMKVFSPVPPNSW
ncbi:hypothetical protein HU200_054367 [Digitaria exilis]|uniref:Uncharacterized protein n=1 Tax=Digitaria exilis TaxID=1010633 RepID=A0A835AKT1_9POAL|nr:hypothetical protein HU200_054367 [Digitaria exilis]